MRVNGRRKVRFIRGQNKLSFGLIDYFWTLYFVQVIARVIARGISIIRSEYSDRNESSNEVISVIRFTLKLFDGLTEVALNT